MKKINLNNQTGKFATHHIFDIDSLDWLCQHLNVTPIKLSDGFSTLDKFDKDYSSWQERCACIGMMTPPARALCSLLVWGLDKQSYNVVCEHLSNQLLAELKKSRMPKGCVHSREELSKRMAQMVWHLHLWNMWDLCTVKGRLYFFGIEIGVSTYKNNYIQHQNFLITELNELVVQICIKIDEYRKSLYYENSA